MKKPLIFLVLVGGLIGMGIILSVYGNFLIFQDLNQGDGEIFDGNNLAIKVELDHTQTQTGIYAIQIFEFERAVISATILDPFGTEIKTHSMTEELFEGLFDVSASGEYTLLIENSGEQVKVFGVIGPEPVAWKQSVDTVSFIILAIGLIGMVALAISIIISRKKDLS